MAVKTLKIQLPDLLAKRIETLVEAGWFASEEELARLALSEFLRHHSFELQEQFQRDDIQWALSLKPGKP
jgi:Arc/MetJ-type ribon-helix-helix transcriptional regulator